MLPQAILVECNNMQDTVCHLHPDTVCRLDPVCRLDLVCQVDPVCQVHLVCHLHLECHNLQWVLHPR